MPRFTPGRHITNSIIAPLTAAEAGDIVTITPTNPVPEETLKAGMIDFRKMDLDAVLMFYADLVNRTVLRPSGLAAQPITLKTQTDLTKREAVEALDTVLGMNGIVMINVGEKFVKAQLAATAGTEAQEFNKVPDDRLPIIGGYISQVVQLKYAKPSEMVPVLQPLAKMPGAIVPIESSGILVLRDYTENIKRMAEMIREVDIAFPSEWISEVIPIKYALATDIASALNSLSTGGGGSGVVGGSKTATRANMSSGLSGRGGLGGGLGGGAGGYGGLGGGAGGYGGLGGASQASSMGTTTGASNPQNSFASRLNGIINRAAASGEIQILGQTKIIADERSNALLIYATKEDMKTIKDIISKLDVVLAQVLIETVIMEVNVSDTKSLAVSYQEMQAHGLGNYFSAISAINNGNGLTPGSFAAGLAAVGTNAAGAAASGASGLPGGYSGLAALGNDLDVTVTALASLTHGKVLQCPRIQTENAKQASLFVGETVPYPSGSYYGGGAYGGYSSIQQMQIGVSIDVTPLINPNGLVSMDIHQKIDDVQSFVNIANVGNVPVTSSKEAQTSVAVRDRDTIIMGGLISTSKTDNNSGVPLLKDIPLLGALFRSSSSDIERDDLIVLIRPTVLPTPEVAALTATAEVDKMPSIKGAQHEMGEDLLKQQRALDKKLKEEDRKRLQEAEKQRLQSQPPDTIAPGNP